MEVYIEIIFGILMSILLVFLVGWSIKGAVGRWREWVRERDRNRVEEERRRRNLSERERRRFLETVGILRRDTGGWNAESEEECRGMCSEAGEVFGSRAG